ncbi:MAG: SecF protein [Candidatus Woesebacteria bacterium GW2011_GWA1_33_30]|uniref:Protein-export membrane protein SecF n=1 Tax=Candidatus Woesebacteria bacterium GW2011_GWA2_33_28 TaxID=1618561 RepID=A0A0G0CWJ0_9BACT|nr:MAG: SecF protein [Candidatus Woesebacteria bacterium GW2011_GWA2_33_28]KKP48619.1 MAG: SecF protein [Candidatus Woesebacteria bacterium GW2011_GWA1_33_30]KKP49758.1 MAG: SecF protein [Microgenomates group bacterium GW2011_GWC1_33_32]KKP52375.1 MAG: SecF protein [Candidatus Woesebacteria bacterium GW2011_GWB1_33_38]KKP57105.1 MAG: SecF protein [Microgenomates group bacterium GW2011_GWD1_33_9]
MQWMKYRLIYLIISGVFLTAGIFSLFKWGLNLGIDFTGGVVTEYKLSSGEIETKKFGIKTDEEITKIREDYKNQKATELRFETVGPSIGPELIKKTFYALAMSAILILVWVAIQFKSIKFGVSAILAMIHDSLVLVGGFSLLGHFAGVEVDFLFVTAVLTILSFSVHDTIVVYDRIREKQKKYDPTLGSDIKAIANSALTETMVRSLNNSFTIIFMLLSLVLLGGDTVKWFAVALLIGTISGTYSSPFVAVPILVTWEEWEKRLKK